MSDTDVARPTSRLAIWSLVTAILCAPVGVVLSIVALVKVTRADGALGGQGLAIAGLVVSLVLSLIVVPVGVLGAVAVPNFVRFSCRAKQSEAKTNLKSFYVAEELFRVENGRYTEDMGALEFKPRGQTIRYRYEIVAAGTEHFEARAVATDPALGGDTWTLDENNAFTHVVDGCR